MDCEHCHKGVVFVDVKCDKCKGKGRHKQLAGRFYITVDCVDCDGKGRVQGLAECKKCGGMEDYPEYYDN